MLNQTLKNFYSFLMPSRKTSPAENKLTAATPPPVANADKQSTQIIYHRDMHIEPAHDKAANAHDWWIN